MTKINDLYCLVEKCEWEFWTLLSEQRGGGRSGDWGGRVEVESSLYWGECEISPARSRREVRPEQDVLTITQRLSNNVTRSTHLTFSLEKLFFTESWRSCWWITIKQKGHQVKVRSEVSTFLALTRSGFRADGCESEHSHKKHGPHLWYWYGK